MTPAAHPPQNDTIDLKTLAAASPADETGPTAQQDVDREDQNGRLRRQRKPPTLASEAARKTAKAAVLADYAKRYKKTAGRYPEFAAALRAAMSRVNMRASDLARARWGSIENEKGYSVAKNRDRIGLYLNGTAFPTPENLQKLADALGVPVDELASTRPPPASPAMPAAASKPADPPSRSPAPGGSNPDELVMTAVPARPGRTRLRVDRELSWRLATHIHNLIRQAEDAELRGALSDNPEINPENGRVVGGTDTEINGTK